MLFPESFEAQNEEFSATDISQTSENTDSQEHVSTIESEEHNETEVCATKDPVSTTSNIVILSDLQNEDDSPEEVADKKTETFSVFSYFSSKGIDIDIPKENLTVAPVESLAFSIALNYPQTKAFIRFIRECITKKKFEFTYSLATHSPAEKNAITSLSEKLNEYGLISNLFNNKTNGTLRGTISTSPRCTNFINGDFLEMYARCVAVGVIKKAAEKYNCDYELYHNVLIHKGNENHELDIVFRLGKQVFWGEVKSGKFNPDEYRKLGLFMNFVPDKLILLAAEKSNEAVEAISYFYEYYCANINTFKSSLYSMIDKAMEG